MAPALASAAQQAPVSAGACAALRQLPLRITFELPVTAGAGNARLAEWLGQAVGIDARQIAAASAAPTPIAGYVRLFTLFLREVMQARQLPVFDPPIVHQIEALEGAQRNWRVTITVALIEQIPGTAYRDLLQATLNLMRWLEQQPCTAENMPRFFAEQTRALNNLPQIMPGKSTLPLLRVAHARGTPFIHLGCGIFQLGWGSQARRIDRSTTDADSAMSPKLTQNKVVTAQLLQAAGLPAPTHVPTRDLASARSAAQQIGWPVVVKPADRERGEGVSVDVEEARLEAAFQHALELSPGKQVIVEQQVAGVCHRLFIAGGRLLYAVKRLPIGIYGDGKQSVGELVRLAHAEDQQRPEDKRSRMPALDTLANEELQRQGLSGDSIPAASQFVALRRIESTAAGGVDEDVTQQIHPENLRIALAASRLFGLDVAGIDIITPDIATPWDANGAIINEVNFAPLLGGGEISRAHIPDYLERLLGPGRGLLPVDVFVGGEAAWQAASKRRDELAAQGIRAYLSSHCRTQDEQGNAIPMPVDRLSRRGRALLLNPMLDHLLLVVHTDELLRLNFPLERVDRIHRIDDELHAMADGKPLPAPLRQRLLAHLDTWTDGPA